MTGAASAGLFGKLPARGDFVRAGLPGDFVAAWDDWLQDVLAASRAQLGAAWLPAFLKAPVWRFLLPPGRCGAGGVLGVLLPSVDRVGRYFPLTLAAVMPPAEAAPDDAAWLDAAVAAGLAALERDAAPDEVLHLLPPPPAGDRGRAGVLDPRRDGAVGAAAGAGGLAGCGDVRRHAGDRRRRSRAERCAPQALTHVGNRRSHNEDAFVDRADLGLWAVADGAGGHDAGEVASGMLVETLGAIPAGLAAGDMLTEIRTRVAAVHAALLAEAARRGPDVAIASTLVDPLHPRRAFRLSVGRGFARLSVARRIAHAHHP